MDPIALWVRVHLEREEAFALLDELANHVVDWSFDRPAAGVGGPAGARAIVPGQQRIDTDAIEAVPPGQDDRRDRWRERASHDRDVHPASRPASPATCGSSLSSYGRRAPGASRRRSSGRTSARERHG